MNMRAFLTATATFLATMASAIPLQGYSEKEMAAYVKKYVADTQCYLPLDVMFVQDTTQSYTDDLINIGNQLNGTIGAILAAHPNSEFGVAEFKDRPQYDFGWANADYCYRLASPLSKNPQDVYNAYKVLYGSGGNDVPEDSYLAAITTIQYNAVKWRQMGSAADETGARLLILATDALPHYNGDGSEKVLTGYPNFPGTINQQNISEDCTDYQYPNPDDFANAVKSVPNQYVLFLIPPNDTDVLGAWRWVNDDLLGQPSDFVQIIDSDSSNFIQCVLDALASVTEYVCATTSTPAVETTTTSVESTTLESTAISTIVLPESTTFPTTATLPTSTASLPTTATLPESTAFVPTTATLPETTSSTAIVLETSTFPNSTKLIETTAAPGSTVPFGSTVPVLTTALTTEEVIATTTTTSIEITGTTAAASNSTKPCPCPCPCPEPCPGPCPNSCCCHDKGEVVIKVSDRPKHIEADIEYE